MRLALFLRGSDRDICYVLSEWGGPLEWVLAGSWLMSHTAESPRGPISSYSLHYCQSRQPWWRTAPPPQPSVTCAGEETTHTGTNESNAALPTWTLVETRDTLCFNAALSPCEIAPISSGAHLASIRINIIFHGRCCLFAQFSGVTFHAGFIKEECFKNIDATTRYDIYTYSRFRCVVFARVAQMWRFHDFLFLLGE